MIARISSFLIALSCLGVFSAQATAQTAMRLSTATGSCVFTANSTGFVVDAASGALRATGTFSGTCPTALANATEVSIAVPMVAQSAASPPQEPSSSGESSPTS